MNVTIGQYYPVKSLIHNIDPRVKLIGIIDFICLLFFIDKHVPYIFATLIMYIIIKLSNVPFKLLLRGLRGILFIIIFTFILNLLFTSGSTLLIHFGFIKIYLEGVLFAFIMSYRLVLIIMMSSILTLTTPPIKLTDAIEKMLNPFKKIKLPAHEIAMIMTIALRFIPVLVEEMQLIMKAQKARGANFDEGNIITRVRNLIPILIPLFISAFRRADDLAMAMESRCYRGDNNRTRMKELKLNKFDVYTIAVIVLVTIIFVLIG
ncbi:MAG: energy-coupling factor transporter transmembrane component T family protein [Lachnospirales bacterium]